MTLSKSINMAGGLVLFGSLLLIVTHSNFGQGISPTDIYPIDSRPYGSTYGDWTAKWWQWYFSIPSKDNPAADENGEKCAIGQNDTNVWFLAGSTGGKVNRACTIPAGKAILFPIINVECDYISDKTLKTESDLRECAKEDQDKATNLQVNVDGVPIPDLKKYRMQSPLFNISVPADNVAGYPAGPTQAVSDGSWILLKPLPIGRHDIRFSGSIADFTATAPVNFVTDAEYDITVAKP